MSPATNVNRVSSRLHLWQLYDPSVKADLFSTAIETTSGIFFVDPVPLEKHVFERFVANRVVAGVGITNANHCRVARDFAESMDAPIFAHPDTIAACKLLIARTVTDSAKLADGLHVIEISGAAAGEIALCDDQDRGTIIVGDALINFEPYGFTFLPTKYCSNAKQMRQSLRRLLDYSFERLLFAHGTPLLHSARKRLEGLLGGGS